MDVALDVVADEEEVELPEEVVVELLACGVQVPNAV